MKQKKVYPKVIIIIASLLLAFIFIIPIIWMIFVSLRREGDPINSVIKWFTPPYTFGNYIHIFKASNMSYWTLNSLGIAVITTVIAVLIGSMAAYALSKIESRYNKFAFFFILFGLLIPGEATIIPLYQIAKNLNILDSYAGIILPGLAAPMTVIILKSFFDGIPNELLESAQMDGCGHFRAYISIILPLAKPALASIAIFTFIGSWNNFLWPYLCVSTDTLYTIPLGIPAFNSQYSRDYVLPMTVNAAASLPIIIAFIIFEKQIIKGVTMSGIKG